MNNQVNFWVKARRGDTFFVVAFPLASLLVDLDTDLEWYPKKIKRSETTSRTNDEEDDDAGEEVLRRAIFERLCTCCCCFSSSRGLLRSQAYFAFANAQEGFRKIDCL